MSVKWPSTLPRPSVQGYGIQPGEAIIRTEMESGLARHRRRFTDVPSEVSVRWLMSQNQFAVFEAWYKIYAEEGASYFDVELLGGVGITSHSARFTRQFSAKLLNNRLWEVTSSLEIRSRPTLDKNNLDLLLENNVDGLLSGISRLYKLTHHGLFIKE